MVTLLTGVAVLDRSYANSAPTLLERLILAVPGADMACISGIGPHATRLHTDERAGQVDAAQFRQGAGPCLEAARMRRSVLADVTEIRVYWPGFARSAREAHILSFLVLPLVHGETLLGTVSLYAQHSHAFNERDEVTAQRAAPTISAALLAAGVLIPRNGYQGECGWRDGDVGVEEG